MTEAPSIHSIARSLRESHGRKAKRVAAQREFAARENGKAAEVEDWRRVRRVLDEQDGPRVS